MIESANQESPKTVASHYDDLDLFYREVWGTHVHHGLWESGTESVQEATVQLVTRLLKNLPLSADTEVCDVGCGYGETARHLAQVYGSKVTGFTVSKAQYDFAMLKAGNSSSPTFVLGNWLENTLKSSRFDLLLAIESTEHMPDLRKFFSEAHRVLRPGGKLRICAWLSKDAPRSLETQFLLRPICTEGRLRLGTVKEYLATMAALGFRDSSFEDVTDQVKRTWTLCIQRVFRRLLTDPRYVQFLLKHPSKNKNFLKSLIRIRVAYETKSMLYGFIGATK